MCTGEQRSQSDWITPPRQRRYAIQPGLTPFPARPPSEWGQAREIGHRPCAIALPSTNGAHNHRGRDGGLPPPLPPNRTGGFPASGSPVSDSSAEIGSLGHGLWPARTARSPRSKRLAIVDGLAFVPSFSGGSVCAGWLGVLSAPTYQEL